MYRLLAVFTWVSCAVADTILVPADIDGRIVGGVNTTIREHPYMAALQTIWGEYLCGGSLISADIVVTAAHCLFKYKANEMQVRVGSAYHDKFGVLVYVKAFRRHELYNHTIKEYDVGVIKLATILRPANIVPYLTLARRIPPSYTTAIVTGWGVKCYGSCKKLQEILQKIEVNIIGSRRCALGRFNHGNGIKSTMFCGYAVGKDTCLGDSGGPLVVRKKLVGIVSWNIGCAMKGYPGVYCNVAKVRKWIKKTVKQL